MYLSCLQIDPEHLLTLLRKDEEELIESKLAVMTEASNFEDKIKAFLND